MHHLPFWALLLSLLFTTINRTVVFIIVSIINILFYFISIIKLLFSQPTSFTFFFPVLPLGGVGTVSKQPHEAELLTEVLAVLFGTQCGTQKVEMRPDLTRACQNKFVINLHCIGLIVAGHHIDSFALGLG